MDLDICGEEFWNRTVSWDTNDPVLSRCARQTLLRIVPFLILWLVAPIELLFRPMPRPVPWTAIALTRVALAMVAFLLHVIELGIFLSDRGVNNSPLIDLWAPGIGAATYALVVLILVTAKSKGFVRSPSVWILSLATVFFQTFNYYHFFKSDVLSYPYEKNTGLVFLPVVAVLLILCSIADHTDLTLLGDKPARIDTASFLSFFTFSFVDDLIYTGYKRKLEKEDLDGTREEDKTRVRGPHLWRRLMQADENGVEKSNGLLKSLIKSFWLPLFTSGLWKLISDCMAFVSPLILKWLLYFIASDEPLWHGFIIVLFMLFGTLGVNITINQYLYRAVALGVQVRTSLMCVIYKKAMEISPAARKDKTVGEIVNLMSVDADRFNQLMTWIHLGWAGFVQIGVAIWLLYQELGVSVFAGVGVMLLIIPVNGVLSRYLEKATKSQMNQKDERVKTMSEILTGIKVLKLYAWEKAFMEIVNKVRRSEVIHIRTLMYLDAVMTFIFCFVPVLVAVATFACYILIDSTHVLDPAKVFFSLTIFNLLRQPLNNMPYLFTYMITSYVSLKRLNEFFSAPNVQQYTTRYDDDDNAVVMDSAVFNWNEESDGDFQLKVDDFEVPIGSLVAVVGVVGSGKSSLLSALLCEMQLQNGRVNISSNVQTTAYVPQQAWIQNETLRDNILFGKAYNERKYNKILKACELLPDLAILTAGDQTEIGEKGINLSGGQKQRLSLARACYSESDLFLLDDPLSAVDAHVAKSLFDNVFSSKTGILRDSTRILVTNSVTILPAVDKIFVLKSGCVSESGSYDELIQKKGDFADFLAEFGGKSAGGDEDRTRSQSVVSQLSSNQDVGSGRSSRLESQSSNTGGKGDKGAVGDVLIEDEAMAEGSVKLSVIWSYFKAVPLFSLAVLFLTACHVCDAGAKFWLSIWSQDKPMNGTDHVDPALMHQRLGVYSLLGLANAVFMLLGSLVMARGSTGAAFTLHKNLLFRVLRSPLSFFETTPMGRILNRFSKDIESVDMKLMQLWLFLIHFTLDIISSVIVIMIALPLFIAVIIPAFVIFFLIQRFYIASSRQFKRLESTSSSPIFSKFSETLAGISTIRAYAANDRFLRDADRSIDENVVCSLCSVSCNRWLSVRLQFIGNIAVFFSGIFAVMNRSNIGPGIIGLSILYSMDISFLLSWLIQFISQAEVEMVSVERILEYTENPSEGEWESSEDQVPPADWPSVGDIEFKKYSVRYRPGLELVVQDISFAVAGGQKIGIVGRTGAGKSTITLSLFRILEPASGSIVIDGSDIGNIGLHDVRGRLTIIPQDPVLFSGSLRMNLDPTGEKSDEQLWHSLTLSHLKDWVSGLESGLEFAVSEGGENLSVGQRQLLCLARALLRKTQILVLDEATAAVDLETDSLIQSTIRTEFADCTILTIAHRLNTIIDSDKVLVMDAGRVVEFDDPQKLLQDTNSAFYSLALDAGLVTKQ